MAEVSASGSSWRSRRPGDSDPADSDPGVLAGRAG